MIQLHDGDLLYHTSYLDISKIDLNKGKRGLDFGGGYNALGSHALKRILKIIEATKDILSL
ncbi:MAG: DUF3990 domain-containing protein [Clostridiales bacterium]|nr:DUF3990 domain-containing protein [Clostridiales bacterium]